MIPNCISNSFLIAKEYYLPSNTNGIQQILFICDCVFMCVCLCLLYKINNDNEEVLNTKEDYTETFVGTEMSKLCKYTSLL